jgi:YrbI family 3-deoxy-D-manno-octulosonate 8-phosphate phosphatase
MSYLHQNIKLLRKERKLSPTAFAKKALLRSDLARIEAGTLVPQGDELLRIAGFFGLPLERLIGEDLVALRKKMKGFTLKFLAMDVDGVLTDGGMYYSQSGDELKKFNTKDGLGLIRLAEAGIPTAFISSGINDRIIRARAEMLRVPYVYVGTWKKLDILTDWCKKRKIALKDVAYIGDDVNDMAVIKAVGLSACPSDAVAAVKNAVDIILDQKGGAGCVREFIERFVMSVA